MVAGVEISMDSGDPGGGQPIRVRMLGPLALQRDGRAVPLPASRKVRGLLAYLALAPRAMARSQLCELLWEVPNDPRGELRWCLSKMRSLVDEPGRPRVRTGEDSIVLDLAGCFVDAIEVARAVEAGIETLALPRQRALAALFDGEFLEGLEIERSPAFSAWLTAQRRRFRGCRVALLQHLAGTVADDEAFGYLEQWLQLAPFDRHVHERFLTMLVRCDRIREGEEHLAAAARLFEAEGLDWSPIRSAWRSIRAGQSGPARGLPSDPAMAASGGGDRPMASAVSAAGGARSGTPAVPAAGGAGSEAAAPAAGVQQQPAAPAAARRASIAVMPFVDRSGAARVYGGLADALAHDVITRLAKLRSLFVIAQGTVFALHERNVGPEEAARMLGVDYVVSGAVQRRGRRLVVEVELTETCTARIVWAEVFDQEQDDAFLVLEEIGNSIVASAASEIEAIERNRAILKPPSSLDAWEAHHRGLWHMYRFSKPDNGQARHFFEMAIRLDPTFARAHAGLSFTHFQDAFQGWTPREPAIDRAFEAAGQSLMADDRDPAAHWAMGRALWLRGRHERSIAELEQAIGLSPNFALGHYTLAFVHSQAGDPRLAIVASEQSWHLSPFDPLLFGMFGARAMALARLGQFEEAAGWAVKAAARPNAHQHIYGIAALCLALAGSLEEARVHAAAIRRLAPGYSVADFLRAFRFDAQGEALFREAARLIGMA